MARIDPWQAWMMSSLMSAMAPLGQLSLILSVCGLLAILAGGDHMILAVSPESLAAVVIVAVFLEFIAVYFCKYTDYKKHQTNPAEVKFSITYAAAIVIGTALSAFVSYCVLWYIAPASFGGALEDPMGCYVLAVVVSLVVAWVLDSLFVHLVADGTAGALIIKAQAKTAAEIAEAVKSAEAEEQMQAVLLAAGLTEDKIAAIKLLTRKKE